jgi:predicted nucleotidyltransferase
VNGAAELLSAALEAIRWKRPEARQRGLGLVGVAGSVARHAPGPNRDRGVVYEIDGRPTLFDAGEISMDMRGGLGREVDMIGLKTVRPRLREAVEHDLVRA